MRRLPRIRAPAAAGLIPSQVPPAALRAPAAAAAIATTSTPNLRRQDRRYLSTTLSRPAQPQPTSQSEPAVEELEEYDVEAYDADGKPGIATSLVYPQTITTAPAPAEVPDPAYKPAETAEGLEEVGGTAGWWDEPAHWGNEGGVAAYVRSVLRPFGPSEKLTDPAVLEVLARRALVEALVVSKFTGRHKRRDADRLLTHPDGMHRLHEIVQVELAPGAGGRLMLKEEDRDRVVKILKSAANRPRQQPAGAEGAEQGAEAPEAESAAEPAPQLTQEAAADLIAGWGNTWKKAEVGDALVKYYFAKRIQQLTGHRIPDGKLVGPQTVGDLLKLLVAPPKPKKLAELLETQAAFQGLPNVRVFPRRVTPIDKEKMVGRWKVMVSELEKRDLPVIGTGDHSPAVEKRWVSGKA